MKDLFHNFRQMPPGLKMITGVSLASAVFVLMSAEPGGHVTAFGMSVSVSQWWASGAGMVILVIVLLLFISAILMLRRSPWGRPLQVLAWLTLSASIPLIARLTSAPLAGIRAETGVNFLFALAIGVYLYGSKRVRDYFEAENEA